MAVSTVSLNDINFDSFFQNRILDNNNVSVTDINAGLNNLFKSFNETADSLEESQRYLVKENEEGYPDLVALHCILNDPAYWWWILLLNRLENPMEDIKANYIYSINSQYDIKSFIDSTNEKANSGTTNRMGTVVELN